MENEQEQYLQMLCERAANEEDSEKLVELVQEINKLVDEKMHHNQRGHRV